MNRGGTGRLCRLITYGRPLLLAGLAASHGAVWADQAGAPAPAGGAGSAENLPPPVSLKAAPAEPAQERAIIITGSRIPQPNLTAISPVATVTSQEVKLEGVTNMEEALNQLPQSYPGQGQFISNGATGTATIDLRGFGPTRTLVLIDGKRLLPGDPTSPSADINFIPSALVKRVEVLTGGASSVYGSDAVAGVVNFIIDTRLEGIRLDGQVSAFQHDNRNGSGLNAALQRRNFPFPAGYTVDGARQDINLAYGTGFAGQRGHVTIYAGYRHTDPVTQDARDYSACTASLPRTTSPLSCGGSAITDPATFFTFFDELHTAEGRTFDEGGAPQFNFAPFNYYQRVDRRYIAGGFADFEISEAAKPYLEVMFMDDKSTALIAPSADFFNTGTINCDNPLLSPQQLSNVCFEGNYVGEVPIFDAEGNFVGVQGTPTPFIDPVTGKTYYQGILEIGRRNTEGGGRTDTLTHRDLRAIGGIRGDVGKALSYDASYLFGRVTMTDIHDNDLSISRLGRALDVVTDPSTGQPVCRSVLTGEDPACVPWDIFDIGTVTPAAAAYLNIPSRLSGTVEQKVASVNVTAQLGEWGIRSPWADDGPALNVGAESRTDTLELDPDEHFQAADLTGLISQLLPFKGSTSVKELFGEVRIPVLSNRLIKDFTIEGGYRQSWQSNPENRFTTDSYKIAAELSPVEGIRLRASQQRAVRAPNIQELFAPQFPSAFAVDPCTGLTPAATLQQCQSTGVTPAQYGHIVANPLEAQQDSYNAITGGFADLQPETALTRTIGIVLRPRFLPRFSLTVDGWDIKLKGVIGDVGAQLFMDTCIATADPIFCSRIHRDQNGSLWLSPQGYIDDRLINAGGFSTRGIDVAADYSHRLGKLGTASAEFDGTWTDRFVVDLGGLSTPFDCAGHFGYDCGVAEPHWRHNLRLTWDPGPTVSLSVKWRYIGKATLDRLDPSVPAFGFLPPPPKYAQIDAQSYFDVTASFRLEGRYQLRLGARNLFDKEPPLIPSGKAGGCGGGFCNGNTFPQLYDPLGRFIFAGFTVDLKPR